MEVGQSVGEKLLLGPSQRTLGTPYLETCTLPNKPNQVKTLASKYGGGRVP